MVIFESKSCCFPSGFHLRDKTMLSSTTVLIYCLLLLTLQNPATVYCCFPGRSMQRMRRPGSMTPLVYKQHVPNVPELGNAGSGPADGPVRVGDQRYKMLVANYNPDVIFPDELGSGNERLMTRRCKEKTDNLALLVMNYWNGMHLRVTSAYDTRIRFLSEGDGESLHYEGRAVDITTSDNDRRKLGMLARLAEVAGFDWVTYGAKGHVHASVKSDTAEGVKIRGCLSASDNVTLSDGTKLRISRLRVGDTVMAVDARGYAVESEVIGFLDRNPEESTTFLQLQSSSGLGLKVTPYHIVYRAVVNADHSNSTVVSHRRDVVSYEAVFASELLPGDFVLQAAAGSRWKPVQLTAIDQLQSTGYYAPLTVHGNIVVNDVVVSCYALTVLNEKVVNALYLPYRKWHQLKKLFYVAFLGHDAPFLSYTPNNGIHWYSKALLRVAQTVLSPLVVED